MKKTAKTIHVIAAVLFGAVIGVIRVYSPGTPYLLLIAAAFVACAALAVGLGRQPLPEHSSSRLTSYKTAIVTASLLLFIAAAMGLFSMLSSGTPEILTACVLALATVSAFGIIYTASRAETEAAGAYAVVPVYFMGLLLLYIYKQYVASSPYVSLYGTEIAATALMTLAAYSASSMRFLKRSTGFLIICSILGSAALVSNIVVSKLLTLGENRFILGLPSIIMLAAMAIYTCACYIFPPSASEAAISSPTFEPGKTRSDKKDKKKKADKAPEPKAEGEAIKKAERRELSEDRDDREPRDETEPKRAERRERREQEEMPEQEKTPVSAAFYDHQSEPELPDLDSIIEEVKSERAAEAQHPEGAWDFLSGGKDKKQ